MKKTLYFTSALLIFGLFIGCEKFELEDHCPEEDQQGAQFDPQDVRSTVNDDSDSEDDVKPGTRSLDDDGNQHGLDNNTINKGQSSDGSSDGNDDDETDDLINDDSDDEDEGEKPRSPGNNPSNPNGGR